MNSIVNVASYNCSLVQFGVNLLSKRHTSLAYISSSKYVFVYTFYTLMMIFKISLWQQIWLLFFTPTNFYIGLIPLFTHFERAKHLYLEAFTNGAWQKPLNVIAYLLGIGHFIVWNLVSWYTYKVLANPLCIEPVNV